MAVSWLSLFCSFFRIAKKKIMKKFLDSSAHSLAQHHHHHIVIILRAVYKYQFNFCHFTKRNETNFFSHAFQIPFCERKWMIATMANVRLKRCGRMGTHTNKHSFCCLSFLAPYTANRLWPFFMLIDLKCWRRSVLKFQFVSGKQSTQHSTHNKQLQRFKLQNSFSHTENNCNQNV